MSMPRLEPAEQWMKDSMAFSPKPEAESSSSSSKKEVQVQTKKTKKEQQSWKSDSPTQKVPTDPLSEEFIILNTQLLEEEKRARETRWVYPPKKMDHFDFLELINDRDTERVAKGGFGVVYKVSRARLEDLIKSKLDTTKQTVAIKIFSRLMTPETIKEIGDEVRSLRAFKNECQKNHIVCYIGDVEVLRKNDKVGDFFVVMEYVDGPNLRRGVSEYWKMYTSKGDDKISMGILIRDMMTFIKHGAIAIKTIHALGFAHNDIKPENFVLDMNKKRGVLVDLGLACKMLDCEEGFAGGTVLYYSLEKFNEYKKRTSGKKTDGLSLEQLQRADLWAFAIVVETLLSRHGVTNVTAGTFESMLNSPSGYQSAFFGHNGIKMHAQASKGGQAIIDGYNKLMDMAILTLSRPIWTMEKPWATPDDYIMLVNQIFPSERQ